MNKKQVLKGNQTKPKVAPYTPQFVTNTVTDNVTNSKGEVVNRLADNADFDRDFVNMNKK